MSDERESPDEPTGEALLRDDIFPEQDDVEVKTKRPITARGAAIVGVRVVAGLVGIGVALTTVAASTLLPLPTVGPTPASELVTPVPTAQQLVCPGSVLRLSDETGQGATTPSPLGTATADFVSSSGSVDVVPLDQSDAGTGGTGQAPAVISTPPNPADPTERILLSGAQAELVQEADFVGLAAADCGAVSGDTWLAGGSTAVGRTTLLTLSNPTEVAATVNLELFGESGAVVAPGTSGIMVPASGQRVLSLAGFKPDLQSPVVHVTSSGGQIVAQLQQATVRGLAPGGLDIVGTTQSPSTSNTIPGLLITDLEAVQALFAGGAAFDDLRTTLRVFAPGEGSVSLTINVVPEDGQSTGTSFALDIDAGRVVDVPLEELETGSYTVQVSSTAPVLAAARVASAAGEPNDFAWLAAAPRLVDQAQFTAADGPSPQLHLSNSAAADATVTLTGGGGDAVSVVVLAGASAIVALEPGASYVLGGFESLYASVTLAGDGMIAGYAVHPPGVGSTPVTVYPHG
jgi:hypothetical protein